MQQDSMDFINFNTNNLSFSPSPAHVLIFPFPVQGHINSMLKLAELLCLADLNVTFLNTNHNQHRLVQFTDAQARFSEYPGFQFQTIPDGLPVDHPRAGNQIIIEMFEELKSTLKPVFKDFLLKIQPRVDCIVLDGVFGFILDVAMEVGVPVIYFRTSSPCCFWSYFCTPDIIRASELPIRGNEDMDRLITQVPGMETFLRCRDLPSFCRFSDMPDPTLVLLAEETQRSPEAHALILNTFEDLDSPILSQIRTRCPRTYSIGPLHEHLKTRLQQPDQFSNSLWEVDRSCITWLDNQPEQSVLYVSFGSLTVVSREQVLEFWHGLINSKKRFLWVMRPDSVVKGSGSGSDADDVPEDLLEGTKARGYMVGWAPQEEVLGHKAIGGFLTHSGWNSTLESIVAGVPMICWPYFADQQVNSRFVSEVWKLGIDMKDVCDRKIVEKMVNDLMVERRDEFARSAARMAALARESLMDGGSSCRNLDLLIEDIRLMGMQGHEKVENTRP